ncbi:MAG: transposase [Desulfuromonadales bacterium]|nr:transposase [Desulfuromonadales bacterium]
MDSMSGYNPDKHHRRSIRLKNYDYSQNGSYFLTLCTFDRSCYFEQFGQLCQIVEAQWQSLPERFSGVALDEYVVMPNHFHGIIVLCRDTPCGYPGSSNHLGNIVGSFKSLCVNAWLKIINSEKINARGKFWQGNYYEHIIRNNSEMERIRRYIAENPLRWSLDQENPGYNKHQEQQKAEPWMM